MAGGQLLRLDVALTRIPRGQATLIVDAAAEASLDGRSLGAGPMRQVLHLAPGAHSLRVVGPEGRRPVRVDFEVADGARETLRISERDLAPIEAPVAPWIVAGAGLALGVGGVVTCVQASDLRAEFAADRDADGYYLTKTDAQRAAAQRRLQRLDGATAALWATGGAAIAAGLVWWWIASDEADDDVILVAPMAGPGTAGAAAQGRF